MDEVWHPSERWSDAERAAWQNQRLREVATEASATAPALHDRLEAAGLRPGGLTVEALASLPVLRKESLPEAQRRAPPFAGWLGVPVGRLGRVYRSPGPILDPEGREDDYWRFAPALFAAGLREGDLVLNTLAYHLTPVGHMLDSALRILGCPVVPSGPGNTEVQVALLAGLSIAGFVGTPSYLATVLEAADAVGATVRLRTAFVIAEMLSESLRGNLEDRFGVRITQGYGTADLGSVGFECSARNGFHVQRETVVELLDPASGHAVDEGAPGEVVVTALNSVYPLLRFGTGDLAAWASGRCACGRTGPRLQRILGRVGDAVKVRGMFLHPAEVDVVIARYPEVARYQVVVTRSGHDDEMLIRAELHPDRTPAPDLGERIRHSVRDAVRLRGEVELVAPGTLPANAGKIADLRKWD